SPFFGGPARLDGPMETPVEIRYAGVVVARANEVRRMTVGGVDMFLSMPEPLPAGTVVSLSDGAQARVEKVIESSDPSVAGIYIKMLNDGEAGLPWVPAFRESEVPAPRPPAVVVSPVIVRPVHRPTPAEVLPSRAEPIRVEQPPAPPPPAPPPPEPVVAPREHTPEVVAMVAERGVKRERSKRSTIVMAVPPPAEIDPAQRPEGAVNKAAGEIDTGSRRIQCAQAEAQSASIVVEPEPAEAAHPDDEPKQSELRLEDLSTARPLPSARGRATKRRKTTQR